MTTETEEGSRSCEWCADPISVGAFKCPRCGKWRKDIDKDRILCYIWSSVTGFPILLFFIGLRSGWWTKGRDYFGHGTFSLGSFIFSFSGLLILGAFGVMMYYSFQAYARVSKKIGTWVWY